MRLTIQDISHVFNGGTNRHALEWVSFEVENGQFVALLGPSGCGKSTLLRLCANLLKPSGGKITFDGKTPAQAVRGRQIAWLAQSPALLPWLTSLQNVELACRFHNLQREPRLLPQTALDMVGLADAAHVYPSALSGGMQQRLALARVLTQEAALWLMDEPFAALDELTRERMTVELAEIWNRLRPTVVWVTHNMYEALRLADRVLVFSPSPGRILADIQVQLPRPRVESEPEYQRLLAALRAALQGHPEQMLEMAAAQ
jgi:NitT/TauT family transport system ATP-binding protein